MGAGYLKQEVAELREKVNRYQALFERLFKDNELLCARMDNAEAKLKDDRKNLIKHEFEIDDCEIAGTHDMHRIDAIEQKVNYLSDEHDASSELSTDILCEVADNAQEITILKTGSAYTKRILDNINETIEKHDIEISDCQIVATDLLKRVKELERKDFPNSDAIDNIDKRVDGNEGDILKIKRDLDILNKSNDKLYEEIDEICDILSRKIGCKNCSSYINVTDLSNKCENAKIYGADTDGDHRCLLTIKTVNEKGIEYSHVALREGDIVRIEHANGETRKFTCAMRDDDVVILKSGTFPIYNKEKKGKEK